MANEAHSAVLGQLKTAVQKICRPYKDREQRARRLFMQERAASLHGDQHREFQIKTKVSKFFDISYSSVSFCGSAQIGFSIHKNRLFVPGESDLDIAIIDTNLYQKAWIDIITTTRAFSDPTPFSPKTSTHIELFQSQILRRGMIRISAMPKSAIKQRWTQFEHEIGLEHTDLFKTITIAIYINEYAFCWKQDSSIAQLTG